jgi:lipooligosaccharide transport system permease protein
MPTALVVPIANFTCGLGFAFAGIAIAGVAKSIDNFNYVTSAVITPIFLLAGTYFPISGLPDGIAAAARVNPLYHMVQLVRDLVLHVHPLADLGHFGVLVLFAVVMWRVAIFTQGRQLID